MKYLTNKQIIRKIMDGGTLNELFVMDAIHKYAEAVAKSSPRDYPKNGGVNPKAWIDTGKRVRAFLRNPEGKGVCQKCYRDLYKGNCIAKDCK